MSEHTERIPPTGTICTVCRHVLRPESFCQRFRRRLQKRPPAVLECSGYSPEDRTGQGDTQENHRIQR